MARSKLAKAPSAAKKAVKKTAPKSSRTAKPTSRKTDGKHVGDVLGLSRARAPKNTPRATKDRGGNPKGIEIGPQAKGPGHLKPARARF